MIIKNYEIQKIKKNNHNFYLLYGENKGFKDQFIKENFLLDFKKNIFRYDEKEINDKYEDFISSIKNKSFFEDKKLIIISNVSEKITKLAEEIISLKIYDITFIINAGVLEKKSKLRSLFEKHENAVCIPFYSDDNKSLSFLANNFFKKKKISISQESINFLVERCSGDRGNLINELNKIENYCIEKAKVSLEEIDKLTNLSENYSVNELIDNCLAKNQKRISAILNQNNFSNEDCILILRTMLSKSKRILNIKEELNYNDNIESVISSYKPPIFWKDKNIVKKQIINWDYEDIEKLIYKINNIELTIKKNSINSLNIVSDFIINESN